MRTFDRTGLAVTVAVALTSLTARPLTRVDSYLGTAWLFMVGLLGLTVVLRRAQLPQGVVLGTQVVAVAGATTALASTMSAPGSGPVARLVALVRSGVEHMQESAAPMPPNDGVELIFLATLLAIWVVTDLLVVGLARPAWALAPLAVLFAVPAVGLNSDSGVLAFGSVAVGYIGILAADGLNHAARWTRGLSGDSADSFGTATPVVWRAAALVGVPALVATTVAGAALPTLSLPGFGFGNGPGGGASLQLADPTLDLRRNLNQPVDRTVIEYRTTGRGGEYLRMASLPELSAQGWRNVGLDLTESQTLPPAPGLTRSAGEARSTDIRVLDFRSDYLPLPYAPRSFSAPGQWAYERNSLIVLSSDQGFSRGAAIRNLEYSAESVDVTPTGGGFARAEAGTPPDAAVTTDLPDGLPDSIVALTARVTAGAGSDAAKAAAIQAFLRSDEFTYSTETLPGTGLAALEDFLLRDRRGYCEQFAGAMATMARVVDIPTRVAVGFLPGERRGDVWEVGIRDMHAWPELYFADYGWVRFEPTPATVTGNPPAWTLRSADPATTPTEAPTAAPSVSAAPTTPVDSEPADAPSTASSDGVAWARMLAYGGIGLVVVALVLAPMAARRRRRSRRLTGAKSPEEQVEDIWAEIRDTVVDYGGSWPAGSPRRIGAAVGERLERPESASLALLATLVERARYARSGGALDADGQDGDRAERWARMAREIRRGLAAPVGTRRRALAELAPRSLFRRR